MPVTQTSTNLGLSITNPLVLYRALLATRRIQPDPAQHRLALELQKLYFRLKDYDPDVEFRYRLDRATKLARQADPERPEARKAVFDDEGKGRASRWFGASHGDGLGLVKTVPVAESAMDIDSPQGMLLYGEVGRGKSMLIDLLYDSLPTKKKRRWHFNTFMLDIFRRLELSRVERLRVGSTPMGMMDHEHVVLALARETMETSPILFMDEFQLPDRVAGKLVNGFLISFFSLGGVLIASSNRMPEELAKAQGMEFRRLASKMKGEGRLWWQLRGRSEGEKAAASDFGMFVEVLKKRCDVWEMEGERDWRRDWESLGEVGESIAKHVEDKAETSYTSAAFQETSTAASTAEMGDRVAQAHTSHLSASTSDDVSSEQTTFSDTPQHYHVSTSTSPSEPLPEAYLKDLAKLNPTQQWIPSTLTVYARKLHLPQTSPSSGVTLLPFSTICATNLGPADYISICSSFHTLIITSVPVLTTLQKNEARRFITLLDACYEARCKLLIEAAAPPDKLFFPEIRVRRGNRGEMIDSRGDSIESEAFSEMYQESTAPFRPNVSSYTDLSASPTKSIYNPDLRSVLADEDADFGPTYGNGRSHGRSESDGIDDEMAMRRVPKGFEELDKRQGPDFTQTGALTGEDERFAYKRARSRLWEMCGQRWWQQREGRDASEWWKPVQGESRFWEKSSSMVDEEVLREVTRSAAVDGSHDGTGRRGDSGIHTAAKNGEDEGIFRHGASPFRNAADPPPKFGWQHAWGMMKWGKKAGEWGKGVEGNRFKEKEGKTES